MEIRIYAPTHIQRKLDMITKASKNMKAKKPEAYKFSFDSTSNFYKSIKLQKNKNQNKNSPVREQDRVKMFQ